MFAKVKSKAILALILTLSLVIGMVLHVQQSEGSVSKNANNTADFYWMCADEKVNFTAFSLGYNIINYTWHFGDENISYGEKTVHTYSISENYTIQLIMRTSNGSTVTISRYLNMLGEEPEVDFYWTPESPTTKDMIYFFDNSTDPDNDIYNWTWVFGDGHIAYGKNVTHRFIDNGIYDVTLVIRDHSSGGNSITKQIIVLNVPPTPDFYWNKENNKIRFLDYSIDADGEIVNWTWYFGDGYRSYEQNPLHDYSINKSYSVRLKIRDNDGDKNETVKVIDITNPLPTASFSWTPHYPTILDIVYFTDLSSDNGEIVNWTWDFGDGNKSYKRNPAHQYSNKGTYSVNLTLIDDEFGLSIVSKEIEVVNALPIANFSWNPEHPTPGETINFIDLSNDYDGTIVNWTWDFGDGNVSYTQNTTHIYDVNGTYKINLTVTDDDGGITWKEEGVFVVADIYVDDDATQEWYDEKHVRTIQEGIINATSNAFVYILDGTYNENVIVDKTVHLTAKNASVNALAADNTFLLTAEGIEIAGLSIQGASQAAGIEIQSNNNVITDCFIEDNKIGIYMNGVSNTVVFQTKIAGCGESILINNSHDTAVNKTTFDDSTSGITIRGGNRNDIVNSTFLDLTLYALGVENGIDNKISHSMIKFNPYGVKIFSDAKCSITANTFTQNGYAIYSLADNITIEKNEFNKNDIGVYILGNTTEIKDCTFTDRIHGIKIEKATHTYIQHCTFTEATAAIAAQRCSDLKIAHSTFNKHDSGLQLASTEDVEIINCSVWESKVGVELEDSMVEVIDCLIHNESYGFSSTNSSLYIFTSSFNDNTYGILGENSSIYLNDTTISRSVEGITALSSQIFGHNTTLKNNVYGLKIQNSEDMTEYSHSHFEHNEYGLYLSESSFISVVNCSFLNNSYGTYGKNNEGITQINNIFLFNEKGIVMKGSNSCSFIRQNIMSNTYGMELTECIDFEIMENKVENNTFGLKLSNSPYTTLSDNQFNQNTYNFDMEGISTHQFYENIDTSNTINDEPIYYVVNESNLVFEEPIGYLGLINCINVTIKNITISNNGEGMLVIDCDDVIVEKSTFHSNIDGSIVFDSSNIDFKSTSVYNNLDDGILLQATSNPSIVNCHVYNNGQRGINIYGLSVSYGAFFVSENEIKENWLGINIENTAGIMIENNTLENNERGALRLFRANHNTIKNNTFTGNGYGIDIRESLDDDILNNYVYKNENGIYVENSDVFINNSSFEGCDVGVFSDVSTLHIDKCYFFDNLKGTLNLNSSLQISNSEFTDNVRGGKFIYSDFVLSNITLNGNIYGIISYDCTQGKITNCSGSGISNNEYALFLNHSKNMVVSHCEIYNNTVGLYLKNASNNRVYDCEIYNNTLGIETIYSSMNKITKSLLHHNSYGIKTKSNESIFFNNSFWKNGCGIWIEGGMNNQIFHNNFAYNTKNAYDNSNNTWDVGYPSGGNYWSDYIGGDKYSGISQNITGDDGIGDIPYSIGSISKDRYPLINMSQEAAPIPNSPPEAFFIYYPQTPFSLEEIVFTDTSTDSNGKIDIKGWTWDFGDGNTSNEQNPKHAYGHTGLYNVTLTISDSQKENASITVQIEVKNVPPTANFSWNPSSPNTQESIHFSDMSFDIDGSILNWTWDFGDGYSSENKNTSHIYRENGVYIVKLTVTDNDGDNAVKTQNIFVKNIPPNADFYWIPDELLVGKQINLTDNSNDIDGNIVSWHWEFGDDDASNEQHPIHSYEKEGKYTITLTIKDDDGDEAKIEKTIEIQAEKTPGFELLILILAALLIFAKRKIIFKK